MLVPIDQYKKSAQKAPTAGRLKFLPPKPKAPVQRPDIRQSENYKNAVTNADRMAQESQKASSVLGMARNFAKALPRATADTLVGTPVKFAVSAAEVPKIVKDKKFTDKTYNVPGLSPFKSFQSDYGNVADQVVSGQKGMGSAAWALAKIPLAGLETAVIGKGLVKGGKALMGGDIKNAAANVADAILPTNFSTRASSRTGLAPLPRKSQLPETQGTSQLKPLPARTVPLEAVRPTTSLKGSSYRKSTPKAETVNPELADSIKTAQSAVKIQEKTRIPSARQDQVIYKDTSGRLTIVDRDAYEGTKDYTGALLSKPDKARGDIMAVVKRDGTVNTQSPLLQEARKGEYLYHGTNETVLENISKEGLKPGRRGQLSLSKDEAYARSYARDGMTPNGKTSSVTFRVNRDLLEGKTTTNRLDGKPRPASDQLHEVLTKETIPPEALEVYKNGKWQPLKENPLLSEARRYKSAEEFVRAQGTPLYRGATKDSMLRDRGRGTSFSIDKSVAEKFVTNDQTGAPRANGLMGEFILSPDAKILDSSTLTASKIKADLNRTNIVKYARDNGYDAINFKDTTAKNTGWASEEEIRILNHDKIKTKSQLTDLYNQATGGAAKTIEKIKNPLNPTGKERGFIGSIKSSSEISPDLASRVEGTYNPTTNKLGLEKAQRTIFDNITEAERIAKNDVGAEGGLMNTELIKHYDSIAQKAKQSGDMATFNQAMDKAVEVAESRAKNLTETAQNLQAASTISKLSPEGLLHYMNKVSRDVGSPIRLSNDAKFDFMRRAEDIQNILDPRERAFKTFDLVDDLADAMPKGKKDQFLNVMNLPRAIMSTGDLSAPLRQGIFTAARHPITFGKNFGKMMKYAFSEDSYRNLKADIITSPNYNLYVKHGLPLTDIGAGLTGREEAFMSNLAEKIPLFGKLAKGSNRAYTGFLNKMRVDLFDDFVNTAKLNGITDQKYFDDAAKFVGSATGRGSLPKMLEGSAPALNSIFFSPRLMASRISLINPAFYMKLEPTVRKEALKSLGAFVGTGMSILALAKANGADVSTDPRSADFGKMKFGNTRYDIWGGFQQYARLIGQLATGEKVSTITGRETTLGQGYNAPTRESIFLDFLKSKEAPIMSLLTRAAQGEKYGEQFNLPVELIDRFLPMVTSDAFDLYKEYGPKGVAGAVPGFFGVGSQTYSDQIPTLGTTESNNPTIKWRSQPGLGETILNSVTGKEVSTLPKEQWNALYEERKQEQIRQAEVDKVKAIVLVTGEPQYVGDTKIYLDNGVVKTKKESKEKRLPLKDQILYEEIQKRKANPFFTE